MKNFNNNLKEVLNSFNNNDFNEEEFEEEYTDVFYNYEKSRKEDYEED